MSSAIEKKDAPGALVEIESARAIQEVQGAIVIARKFPRDVEDARKRILAECKRPALAEAAIYAYPRGGQTVTGPSIRLAEAIAQHWGNFQFGVRELSRNADESTAQAYAWDVERNSRAEKTFQVPHIRYSQAKGNFRLTDPRDIYELIANNGARRVRACILSLVPGDVVEAAMAECEKTQEAHEEAKPDQVKKMLEGFGKFGVTRDDIERYLKRKAEEASRADIIALKRIHTAISDGMAKPEDYFPKPKAASGAAAAREAVGAQAGGRLARMFGGGKKPEPPAATAPAAGAPTAEDEAGMDAAHERAEQQQQQRGGNLNVETGEREGGDESQGSISFE